MTLKLYNAEYENRDDGENSEKVIDNVIMHNHTGILASNVFYPVSFTKVVLPTAKITVTDVNQVTSTTATVRDTSCIFSIIVVHVRSHWRVLLWLYL